MPLARQTLPIVFQGVDTKTDDAALKVGKAAVLENGVFTKLGRIAKRDGYIDVGDGSSAGVGGSLPGTALATYQDVAMKLGSPAKFSGALRQDASWLRLANGYYPPSIASERAAVRGWSAIAGPDMSYDPTTGVRIFAAPGGGNTIVARGADGMLLQGPLSWPAMTAAKLRTVQFAGGYCVTYVPTTAGGTQNFVVANGGAVTASGISWTSPYAGTVLSTSALDATNRAYDACYALVGGTPTLFVAYGTAIGTVEIRRFTLSATAATLVTTVTIPSTTAIAVGLDIVTLGDGTQRVMLSYFAGGSVMVKRYTTALAADGSWTMGAAANVTHLTCAQIPSGTDPSFVCYWTERAAGATSIPSVRKSSVTNGGAPVGPFTDLYGHALAAKPIPPRLQADLPMLLVSWEASTVQPSYFLYDLGLAAMVARFMGGTAGGITSTDLLAQTIQPTSSQRVFPLLKKTISARSSNLTGAVGYVSSTTYGEAGVDEVTLDFSCRPVSCTSGGLLLMTGGVVQSFDGATFGALGFPLAPELVSVVNPGGAGANSYAFVVVWERVDGQGHTQQSAPSAPVVLATNIDTAATPQSFQLSVRYSGGGLGGNYIVYRTEKNGAIYHRCGSSGSLSGTTFIVNTDALVDSDLVKQRQLYTTGGVVDNFNPGPVSYITAAQNRVWAIDACDPLLLWFSHEVLSDTSPEFSDAGTFRIAPRSGEAGGATALAKLDDKVIVFRATGLSYIAGSGPARTGAGNDYVEVDVPTEVGCVDPRSLVTTSAGIFFKSARGIYLLDRGLNVTYVGADVEAYNAATVVAAEAVPSATQVLFFLSTGVALSFDWVTSQWSVFTDMPAIDACSAGGTLNYLRSDSGSVYVQVPGQKFGPGFIPLKVGTGWLHLAGVSGFQRFCELHVLGERLGPSQLRLEVFYDYDDEPDVYEADPAQFLEGGGPRFRCVFKMRRQKATAVKFTLTEVETTSAQSAGCEITAVTCVAGVKAAVAPLPKSRRVG